LFFRHTIMVEFCSLKGNKYYWKNNGATFFYFVHSFNFIPGRRCSLVNIFPSWQPHRITYTSYKMYAKIEQVENKCGKAPHLISINQVHILRYSNSLSISIFFMLLPYPLEFRKISRFWVLRWNLCTPGIIYITISWGCLVTGNETDRSSQRTRMLERRNSTKLLCPFRKKSKAARCALVGIA